MPGLPSRVMGRYEDVFRRSLTDPAGFWAEAANAIDWYQEPQAILDDSNPPFYRWYRGGVLNTCHNALDRHVEAGRADQKALIYDSPVTDTKRSYTYRELRDETARFAGVLASLGIAKGDRVVIYMPMIPEAVIAMLACARLGAVHSVVFGGFAAHELAVRIDDAKPKLIVSASCGIEVKRVVEYKPILDMAIDEAAHKPAHTIIVQRPQATAGMTPGDLDWHDLMAAAVDPAPCVPVAATDPLYILYTSGTTGTQGAGSMSVAAMSSCQSKCLLAVISAVACGRWTIIVCLGLWVASSMAASRIGLYSTIRLTSMPQDADTISLGLASSIRTASSCAANPPNTTECTAPSRAQASIAITASGIIGM